jgi:peptidyl-prolyl cis-trans isomerase A (cyclophilin A)
MADTPAPPIEKMVPGPGELRATFKTSMGDITCVLYEKQAPRTVANFVALATGNVEWTKPDRTKTSQPLYSGTVFHRVIKGFMLQGGCPEASGRGGPGWRFDDEIHPELKHSRPGILSMANAGKNTNGSQFFITEVPTPHLDGKHAVFGAVVDGIDVVKKIASVRTGGGDRPVEPVTIHEVQVTRV